MTGGAQSGTALRKLAHLWLDFGRIWPFSPEQSMLRTVIYRLIQLCYGINLHFMCLSELIKALKSNMGKVGRQKRHGGVRGFKADPPLKLGAEAPRDRQVL